MGDLFEEVFPNADKNPIRHVKKDIYMRVLNAYKKN